MHCPPCAVLQGRGAGSPLILVLVLLSAPVCVLQVWIVDDGQITFYNGDFDDYRNELVREINAELDEDE